MKKFFGKETEVEKLSKLHVELVYQCVYKLVDVMEHFYEHDFNSMDDEVKEISRIEKEADDIRRKMEIEFFKGAFLPFDREDRINLAEQVDSVADAVQSTAYSISLGKITFPELFREDFTELVKASCDTVALLRDCIKMLDVDLGAALSKTHDIEKKEDEGDIVERRIISRLYESYRSEEISILKFMELKNIAEKIGNIADRAEDASDRVPIIVAKRKG
ncbi:MULTISPECIES: TIGR00153 family protein [Methanobacterium]|jgi:predicted phosphate transport protein (TIGR00153 family)|uniref:TIGR00153 family protein n=1 Tax=Methanobacterium veterum TaxID=408577 RepID=A0A9E5A2T3_9EURY|nr:MULTISPECIES: TIGR00153 family protein [Methanobacterium]MCZ3364686.1 TIGR00153 family protein [Methanobacterium veterum]MCZ3372440.1 TIGR00153 family protein [Methanobacterium veterum]